MDMPKPSDKHSRLDALVGEWAGEEKLHPAPWDPAGGTASARIVNRPILDGFGVVQEYQQERDGTVTFKGHGVFWYDNQNQEYVMTWWDSMGGSGTHYRGQFDGDRLVLGAPMPQGGHSRAVFDVGTPGEYAFLMEVSPNGEDWVPAMEGTYAKAKAGAKKGASRKAASKKPAAKMKKAARKSAAKTSAARAAAKKAPAKKAAKKAAKAKRR